MKDYWWIISIFKTDYVGGEGIDDDTYPVKNRKIFKIYGPDNEQTRKNLISEISLKRSEEIDFVWCLCENGEENPSLADSFKKNLEGK